MWDMKIAFTLCLPRDEASVPVVRHLLGGSLRKLGVADECVSDIELAMTEACSNVLRHASTQDDEYEVQVELEDTQCHIRITDTGRGFDHRSLSGEASPSAESGRGIQLMRALLDSVAFDSAPEDGTVVYLFKELEIAPGSPLGRIVADPVP